VFLRNNLSHYIGNIYSSHGQETENDSTFFLDAFHGPTLIFRREAVFSFYIDIRTKLEAYHVQFIILLFTFRVPGVGLLTSYQITAVK